MNKSLFLVLIISSVIITSFKYTLNYSINIDTPEGWPQPIYDFKTNPITESGFQLGRKLFYDPGLSRDNSTSCSSCHSQYTGFAHVDHNVSHGIEGRKGTRNAPALINLIWNNSFHWDGGVNNLEVQPINPIQHVAEMDNSLENVIHYLNSSKIYRKMFYQAFKDSTPDTKHLLKALAQFTASLVSANSKYDRYIRNEIKFTDQEKKGLKLFEKNCSYCHKAPLFNSNKYANNGLPLDTNFNDLGRYAITKNSSDSLKFRIPTLRNIVYTFPYMHDGRFNKLKDVLKHYASKIDRDNIYLSNELKAKMKLSNNDQKDIIAFLYTLTDSAFLYNKRFSFSK